MNYTEYYIINDLLSVNYLSDILSTNRRIFQIILAMWSLVPLITASQGLYTEYATAVLPGWSVENTFRDIHRMNEMGQFVSHTIQNEYLSLMFLAYPVLLWRMIPRIEKYTASFRIIIFFVFLGGVFKLVGWSINSNILDINQLILPILEILSILFIPWQYFIAKKSIQ